MNIREPPWVLASLIKEHLESSMYLVYVGLCRAWGKFETIASLNLAGLAALGT